MKYIPLWLVAVPPVYGFWLGGDLRSGGLFIRHESRLLTCSMGELRPVAATKPAALANQSTQVKG